MSAKIVPVIMCGGAGTRLWPASRESMPKQFIPMFSERSSFQNTILRVKRDDLFDKPIVITSSDFRFVVADQLQQIDAAADIVLEPMRRDSGPAVAVAAVLGAQRSPDTVLLILAADHFVGDADAFCTACRTALPAAAGGMIVTFGVVPTAPATDYGYLKPGAPLDGSAVRKLELFAEKPKQERAEQFVRDGYLWNSGNFLFRSDTMAEEIGRHEPAILAAAKGAVQGAARDLDFVRLAEPAFSAAPKISIDFAVMERTDRSAVLPVTYEWSDLGSWDAVWAKAPRDGDGNALSGSCEVIDARNVLVHADPSMLTSVIGLSDIVVVASPDAVLVAPRNVTGELKTLVERLKARNVAEAIAHRRIYRPWGYLETLNLGERYKVKKLQVSPGHRLSLQKHMHRSEHWVVVRGTGQITVNDDVRILHENESVYMPIGAVHRLANPGRIPLELIEIQVGSYLGDDDIQRFEDDYNRP